MCIAQRVTYLYYLGRYHFANNHFYRAQRCLQSAYDECHARATKQRKLILTFLLASSVCLGRLLSSQTLALPEANWPDEQTGLALPFKMLCDTIREGDVGKFESLALVSALDAANPNDYFLFTAADNDFITAKCVHPLLLCTVQLTAPQRRNEPACHNFPGFVRRAERSKRAEPGLCLPRHLAGQRRRQHLPQRCDHRAERSCPRQGSGYGASCQAHQARRCRER